MSKRLENGVIRLENSVEPLRRAFNREASKTRVVVLLSPTCAGCVHGAGGLKSLLDNDAVNETAVFVVWLPVLPADTEDAAAELGLSLDDRRVAQFFDVLRLTGSGYMRDVFPTFYKDANESIRKNPVRGDLEPLKGMLESIIDVPPETVPLWDAALFYAAHSRWDERFPAPERWIKQIAYFAGANQDGATGVFWVNNARNPLVESDWAKLIEQEYAAMAR